MPNDDSLLEIRSVTVKRGRIVCCLQLAPDAPRYTDSAIAALASARFPSLAQHACVNGVGKTFGAVMAATSIPHLLEHLVIDFQAAASSEERALFVGTTEWTDELSGQARIQLSFHDDLVALGALRQALDALNDLLGEAYRRGVWAKHAERSGMRAHGLGRLQAAHAGRCGDRL